MQRLGISKVLGYLRTVKSSKYVETCRHLQTHVNWENGEFVNSETNILLIGSPGSGKTTVGRILGEILDRPVVDIDDDLLEPRWDMPVAKKLFEVGGKRFLEEEGNALLQFDRRGCVVSLTGSNPMHEAAMSKVAKSGIVIFLDCPDDEITKRLEIMKVNRIVGQEAGVSMEKILMYRQQFYERCYDIRIVCEKGELPESIADKIKTSFDRFSCDKGYISTRGTSHGRKRVPFFHTVLKGLAEDGGLYTRAGKMPELTLGQLNRLKSLDYKHRASRVIETLVHPFDLSPQEINTFTCAAYSPDSFESAEIFPVRHLEENQYTLELFHGPTASFKDGALQLMPMFFSSAVDSERDTGINNKYLILVATSGDTGGAVLDGFSRYAGDRGIGVMVLYPNKGISQLQKHQMTTMAGENLKVVGVDSDFDFCQTTVKQIFQDKKFADQRLREHTCKLSAANSLNWGRLLPQIVYHVSGYLDLVNKGVISLGEQIDMCVPTGNFGNILAAYYAKEMGVPVRKLICASNANNVLTEFLQSGTYDLRTRSLLRTASPAIDILKSSNLERLLYHLVGNEGSAVRKLYGDLDRKKTFSVCPEVLYQIKGTFLAGSCDEEECQETLYNTYKKTGYLLDPHTAVAKAVADKLGDRACPVLISGTAHYAKFADSVLPFLGKGRLSDNHTVDELIKRSADLNTRPAMHQGLEAMVTKPVVHTETSNANYESIKSYVRDFVKTFD